MKQKQLNNQIHYITLLYICKQQIPFYRKCVHCIGFRWPKTTTLGKFWHLGCCTSPLLPITAKFGVLYQTCGVRLRAKFHLDRFILSPSGSEKLQILPFFGLRHFVVSLVVGNLRKFNMQGGICDAKQWGDMKAGLADGSPPMRCRSEAPVGGLGDEIPLKLKRFSQF